MDFKFVVDRKDDNKFNMYLMNSLKRIGVQAVQVADDPEKAPSVMSKYSLGTDALVKQNLVTDDDIVVFSKEDINIVDNEFKAKVEYLFETKDDIGIVGVIGTEKISKDGWWLDKENVPVGHIIKGLSSGNGQGEPYEVGPIGYYDDIVAVDSNFFLVRASLLKEISFDKETLSMDNDLCAMDLCIQALQNGYRIAVADILIYQESTNHLSTSKGYEESQKIFNEKYKDLEFPITINSFTFDRPETVEVEI